MADARRPAAQKKLAQNWLGQFGIREGEYLSMTKSQLRTQQRPDKPLKVQVWATGILHTAGYQGEMAMTMRKSKPVPLAPNDIIKELHAVAIKYFRDAGIEASEQELATLRETKETIRRALNDLEDEGIAQRTNDKGQPLSELPAGDLRKLANGKIRLHFWLKPRNAKQKTVEQDWQERMSANSGTGAVVKNRLQEPTIWKILNIFQIEKPSKSQLSDVEFQDRVKHAYEAARKVFLNEITVDTSCSLPVDNQCLQASVDTPCLPAVDTPGGTLERNIERNQKLLQQQPEIPPVEFLMKELATRHLTVPLKRAGRILDTLREASVEHFLSVLDRRRAAGKITAGLLEHLADDARIEYAGMQEQEKQEQERQREFAARRAEEMVRTAQEIVEHPERGYSAQEIEWANEILRGQGAA